MKRKSVLVIILSAMLIAANIPKVVLAAEPNDSIIAANDQIVQDNGNTATANEEKANGTSADSNPTIANQNQQSVDNAVAGVPGIADADKTLPDTPVFHQAAPTAPGGYEEAVVNGYNSAIENYNDAVQDYNDEVAKYNSVGQGVVDEINKVLENYNETVIQPAVEGQEKADQDTDQKNQEIVSGNVTALEGAKQDLGYVDPDSEVTKRVTQPDLVLPTLPSDFNEMSYEEKNAALAKYNEQVATYNTVVQQYAEDVQTLQGYLDDSYATTLALANAQALAAESKLKDTVEPNSQADEANQKAIKDNIAALTEAGMDTTDGALKPADLVLPAAPVLAGSENPAQLFADYQNLVQAYNAAVTDYNENTAKTYQEKLDVYNAAYPDAQSAKAVNEAVEQLNADNNKTIGENKTNAANSVSNAGAIQTSLEEYPDDADSTKLKEMISALDDQYKTSFDDVVKAILEADALSYTAVTEGTIDERNTALQNYNGSVANYQALIDQYTAYVAAYSGVTADHNTTATAANADAAQSNKDEKLDQVDEIYNETSKIVAAGCDADGSLAAAKAALTEKDLTLLGSGDLSNLSDYSAAVTHFNDYMAAFKTADESYVNTTNENARTEANNSNLSTVNANAKKASKNNEDLQTMRTTLQTVLDTILANGENGSFEAANAQARSLAANSVTTTKAADGNSYTVTIQQDGIEQVLQIGLKDGKANSINGIALDDLVFAGSYTGLDDLGSYQEARTTYNDSMATITDVIAAFNAAQASYNQVAEKAQTTTVEVTVKEILETPSQKKVDSPKNGTNTITGRDTVIIKDGHGELLVWTAVTLTQEQLDKLIENLKLNSGTSGTIHYYSGTVNLSGTELTALFQNGSGKSWDEGSFVTVRDDQGNYTVQVTKSPTEHYSHHIEATGLKTEKITVTTGPKTIAALSGISGLDDLLEPDTIEGVTTKTAQPVFSPIDTLIVGLAGVDPTSQSFTTGKLSMTTLQKLVEVEAEFLGLPKERKLEALKELDGIVARYGVARFEELDTLDALVTIRALFPEIPTPEPTPGPTTEPTPTPTTPPTPDAPAILQAVLGATRPLDDAGQVLGVSRTPAEGGRVLGVRRTIATGDAGSMGADLGTMVISLAALAGWLAAYIRKRR